MHSHTQVLTHNMPQVYGVIFHHELVFNALSVM